MATEKRMIDTNALMDNPVWKCGGDPYDQYYMGYTDALDRLEAIIEQEPTVDAVEVVRCKHCRYCDPENHHCDHPMGTTIPVPRKLDDFCSYGERKDNEI